MGEILADDQYAEWDDFVRDAKGGTIFHMSWYLLALADDLRIHVLRDKEGRIEAGMAVTPYRFLGTKAVRRPPYVPYNGPLVRGSSSELPVARASEERTRLIRLLAESPAMGMYDYCLPPEHTDLVPYLWNGFATSVEYTYQISPAPSEQWHAAMSRNHKKNMRRARNAMGELKGTVEDSDDLEEFHGMMCELADLDKIGKRTFEVFSTWWQEIAERGAGSLKVFRDGDGRALTGNLVVYDWRCSYAVVGGVRGGRLSGPAKYVHRLVFEQLILDAHQRSLTFDFEGSVLPGIEPYFRGWGGNQVPKYRVVKIRRPWTYAGWCLHRYWTRHRKKEWFTD